MRTTIRRLHRYIYVDYTGWCCDHKVVIWSSGCLSNYLPPTEIFFFFRFNSFVLVRCFTAGWVFFFFKEKMQLSVEGRLKQSDKWVCFWVWSCFQRGRTDKHELESWGVTQFEQKPPAASSQLSHHCVCHCVCVCPEYCQETPRCVFHSSLSVAAGSTAAIVLSALTSLVQVSGLCDHMSDIWVYAISCDHVVRHSHRGGRGGETLWFELRGEYQLWREHQLFAPDEKKVLTRTEAELVSENQSSTRFML